LGEIIETMGMVTVGIAVGFTAGFVWRDRISQERRARQREQRDRTRREANIVAAFEELGRIKDRS